jgi:hypothetical protein
MFYSFQVVVLKVKLTLDTNTLMYLSFALYMYDVINSVTASLYEMGEYGPHDYPYTIGSNYCGCLSSSRV